MVASVGNVIAGLSASFNSSFVGIFNQDYEQIFRAAQTIKVVVKEQAKVMEHPVESGIIITDHRIILPVEIEISLILTAETYRDVYQSIKQYYLNGTLLVVQTRSGIYENQIIESLPHEEDPTQFDILTVALSLKQVQFVTPQFSAVPKNNSNSMTQPRGTQQGTPVTANNTSIAHDAYTGLKNSFSGATQ